MSSLPASSSQGRSPALGSRCASCTAPLAADQLFCLQCGARRRDARIPFRDVLATEAAPVVMGGGSGGAPGWEALPPGRPAGAGAYTSFLATLACLMLALGLGVWIGRGQDPPPAAAASAPSAPVSAAAVASTPTEEAASTPADASSTEDAAKDDAAATDAAAKDSQATSAEAKKLDALSPEEYQKAASKLPKEVGTGGAAPPKDDKPAGGGSGFEDFQ